MKKNVLYTNTGILLSLKKEDGHGWVAQLFGALSYPSKGCGFDSPLRYKSRLWVGSPEGAHMGGNQSMFLISVSLFLSLSKVK